MSRRKCLLANGMFVLVLLSGCAEEGLEGPPTVYLDDSVCDQCDMILSDERFVTATIVEGERGTEPCLFDDFNCQVNYEIEHPDLRIVARWSHSYATGEWIKTESAHFLMSPALHTPMGSQTAAFLTESEASTAKDERDGDIMTFDIAWKRLGFTGACCHTDTPEQREPSQGDDDGP